MDPIDFLHDITYDDLSDDVRQATTRCLLDLCGAVVAGHHTILSGIIRNHAVAVFGGDHATLLLDGRRVSAPGMALATGMSIDSFDIHDSYRESLGHAGLHLFAALLATSGYRQATGGSAVGGRELLAALAVGYDVACRAAETLHGTVSDYHTSGAWGSVSSAGIFARLMGFDRTRTREALGIAEYHGPRSQMMRCIDHPTMLKDGSGWGAMAGVSAGMLAEADFTGAPAVTIESDAARSWWASLGSRWYVTEQGFKAHGCCWWAQPAIEAVLAITREHVLAPADIAAIRVETFDKAVRLSHPAPTTTEEAQYSLPFPVGAAVFKDARGGGSWYGLGPHDLLEEAVHDSDVMGLAAKVEVVEAPRLTAEFPKRFLARVTVTLTDGRTLTSPDTTFRGDGNEPFSDAELATKYRWLASTLLSDERVDSIEREVGELAEREHITPLIELLTAPPDPRPLVAPTLAPPAPKPAHADLNDGDQ